MKEESVLGSPWSIAANEVPTPDPVGRWDAHLELQGNDFTSDPCTYKPRDRRKQPRHLETPTRSDKVCDVRTFCRPLPLRADGRIDQRIERIYQDILGKRHNPVGYRLGWLRNNDHQKVVGEVLALEVSS